MGWIIAGSVLAFIALLMFFRVKCIVNYDSEVSMQISYLFFTLRMKERGEGKTKKAQKKKREEIEPAEIDYLSIFRTLRKYYDLLKGLASSALKRMRIDRLLIHLAIQGEDAAQTAILYGEACAAVYPLASFLGGTVGVRRCEIELKPLFHGGSASAKIQCTASIRLGGAIAAAVSQLIRFAAKQVQNNKSQKLAKDGAVK